ncbi:MAG: PAS domain S-box protein, partial [Gemmatimonadota bacterium]
TTRIALPDRALFQAVVRDVTEPVETRRELARAKEKFQGIFDISPVALAIQDPETGRFLEVNRAFESLLGYEESAALGREGLSGLWADPDRRDEILGRVQAGETVRNEEVAFRREDGTPVHLLMSMTEREIAGERYL